jgi:hypothetical protein
MMVARWVKKKKKKRQKMAIMEMCGSGSKSGSGGSGWVAALERGDRGGSNGGKMVVAVAVLREKLMSRKR